VKATLTSRKLHPTQVFWQFRKTLLLCESMGRDLEKPTSLDEVANAVLCRARGLFQLLEYEDALVAFTQCLALTERTEIGSDRGAATVDYLEWRGALVHNIASCHHHLGRFDVAQV
jgi:hypothetical protein